MEVHSPALAKRLWNVLRVAFFMARKGLISKRKLIVDMNLTVKRGRILGKAVGNLFLSSHHHPGHSRPSKSVARGGFGLQDYEFSCSNSPNPVFFHVPRRKHHFSFPCLHGPEVMESKEEEEELDALESRHGHLTPAAFWVPRTPEYGFDNIRLEASDLAPGERKSPTPSPSAVRISDYSSEEDGGQEISGDAKFVDDKAEDFIRRFYEQLQAQSRMQLLQYQETE